MIEYTSNNGYRGVLYGKSSMIIYDSDGKEVMHTGFRSINTKHELKNYVEILFPQLRKALAEHLDEMMEDNENYEI